MIKDSEVSTYLPLFAGYGIELEYMIVNSGSLEVCPISDRLIYEVTQQFSNEVTFEDISWSNELVLHVIELKTTLPAKQLTPLASCFQQEIARINQLLQKFNAKLLPTGCHPWMDPHSHAKLWPHGDKAIYQSYNRIFGCEGHGWSNLQSVHLNLPFANDVEFAKLHTAIRVLLPIIPALSASTPIIDGQLSGLLDTRLEYYRTNQRKIPSITGKVIPELVYSKKEYEEFILANMYREISPYDPEKILQEEWLNSRGAIARFDRQTIEIRIIDTQECPRSDLAIISFVVTVLKSLVNGKWSPSRQADWSEEELEKIFLAVLKDGLDAVIESPAYALLFGLPKQSIVVRELLHHLLLQTANDLRHENLGSVDIIETILIQGNLSERIIKALSGEVTIENIALVYQQLATCLQKGEIFLP